MYSIASNGYETLGYYRTRWASTPPVALLMRHLAYYDTTTEKSKPKFATVAHAAIDAAIARTVGLVHGGW